MSSGSFFGITNDIKSSSTQSHDLNYKHLFEKLKKHTSNHVDFLPKSIEQCKHFWKHAVFYCPKSIVKLLPKAFYEDVIFWQTLLSENPDILEFCPQSVCQNHTLVFNALVQDPTVIRFADKQAVIEILQMDASFSQYLPDAFKDDENIILAAVKNKGLNLQYASDRLKKNETIVRQAISSSGLALQYAHRDLRAQEELVIIAARQNPQALAFMHSELKSRQDFILRLLKSTTLALKFSNFLQDHEEFVLKAVNINGLCLEFASERLRNAEHIVLAAINHNPRALRFASSRLKDDETIVYEAVSKNGLCLAFASKRLKGFETIVYKAVNQNGMALQYADSELKKIKEIVIPACRKDGRALVFAHPQLKKIRSVVLSAVNQNGLALKHAFKDLKRYKEIVMMALSQNGGAIRYASHEFGMADFYVEFAVLSNPRALNHVHKRFMNHKDVVRKVLKRDPYLFEKIDPILKLNKPFLLELLQDNHLIFDRIFLEIKKDRDFLLSIKALECLEPSVRDDLLDMPSDDVMYTLISKIIEAVNFNKLEDSKLNLEIYGVNFSSVKKQSLLKIIHQIAIRTWGPSLIGDFTLDTKEKMQSLQKCNLDYLEDHQLEDLFFNFVYKIEKISASRAKKFEVYHAVLTSDQEYLQGLLTLVPAVWHLCGYDKLIALGINSFQAIKNFFCDAIISDELLDSNQVTTLIDALKTARSVHAVFAYAHHFINDSTMRESLINFFQIVSNQKRLESIKDISLINNHDLTDAQIKLWQTFDFGSFEKEMIDFKSYFKAFLIKADFEEDEACLNQQTINLDHFKQAILEKDPSSTNLDSRNLESILIHLINTSIDQKIILINQALDLMHQQNLLEHDLFHLLEHLKDKLFYKYYVDLSASWQDLFLLGTEVGGSSQRVCGDPQFNRCLLSYLFNPKVKVICLKNHKNGAIKARAILKLMKVESGKTTKPCLLLERLYPRAITKSHECLLIEKAKVVASKMGLDLYMIRPEKKKDILNQALYASRQDVQKLISDGPVHLCPFEYSDVGYGVTNGSYVLNAVKVELN